MRAVFDLEGNGLLDHTTINYLTAPYSLKPTFRLWCAVIHDIDTGAVYRFAGMHELKTGFLPMFLKLDTIIGHNIIDYDLLVLKLMFGIDYKIGKQCYLNGRPVEIIDTLVMSKCLNPDRYGGHGIGDWGQRLGLEKIDWRAKAVELGLIEYNSPKGAEFAQYHPEMLEYNARDCEVNVKVYWALVEEMGDWNWSDALELEHRVRDIATRQSHRGFWFDAKLAQQNVRDLDEKMEKIRLLVEPTLPPKPMGKTKLKEFLPPKVQFKKNGELSENIKKWVAKHNGTLTEDGGVWYAQFPWSPKHWGLPLDLEEPVQTHEPSKISDTTHIKGWLVELGWEPSQYKERDLTVDVKKRKLPQDKFEEACKRYAEQTLNNPFCAHRCRELGVKPSKLLDRLLHHDMKRPLKVYTNPTITVGMEKEIDPALLELADKFPHAKLVSEYLTYAHRRNSILGGGVDPDEFDEDDEFAGKGFLAAERISVDGRIPTPADSCGAGTSRFKHKVVVNVPRSTSLYGGRMRALFGVDEQEPVVQMGYDFASLEAMMESHYCWRYDDEDKTYCKSLTMEKPNDVHTKTAKTIELTVSAATGAPFPFSRSAAKPVKYACVPMHTKALTRKGWKSYEELSVGDSVLGYNPKTGFKEWTDIKALLKQEDEVLEFGHNWFKVQATADHRWYVKQRREFKTGNSCKSIRKAVDEVRVTTALNSESNIIVNAPMARYNELCGDDQISDSKRGTDWQKRVMAMSQSERRAFLEGFMIADGYEQDGRWQWSQNRGDLAEAALLASYLVHDGVVQVRNITNAKSPMINVILGKTSHRTMQTMKMKSVGVQEVWCMETGLGSWVMRQGDTITITGNCAYGAQPARVAKTVGCSLEVGKLIHEAYWEAAKPLAKLGEKLKHYWETTGGKKFILGLDGRKIPTRSASALINSLFQSAGVICAKRTMVLHDEKLEAAGLAVDFFRDNWREKKYAQQLIAMHDEAQMELHRSLVSWKMFKTEDEAKAFKAENMGWSDVGHSPRGYYVGKSIVADLMVEAVKETTKYYKLNVELAADFCFGKNWEQCH